LLGTIFAAFILHYENISFKFEIIKEIYIFNTLNFRTMELKKNEKADLENKKSMYFQIGMVLALGLVLVAFEWRQKPEEEDNSAIVAQVAIEEEMAQVTRPPEVAPPPPPPQISEVLNVVENNIELDNDIEINTESDDNVAVQSIEFVNAAPTEEAAVEEEAPFIMVEDMPTFNGGDPQSTFREWIAKNTKYPEIAQENGISGRVIVQFVVNSRGEITDVKVMRPVDPALDKEAIRVISSSPKWTPGKQRGRAVKVQFTFPVNFVLQ
jgi:protein TonB